MATQEIDDAVWQKILALRDLANPDRGATPSEIEIATSKMNKLLLDHNLSTAMLDLGHKPTHGITHVTYTLDDEAVTWELALLKTLAEHNFCRVIGDSTRQVFVVVGKALNITATWDTYLWLGPKMMQTAIEARVAEAHRRPIDTLVWDEDSDSHWMAETSPGRWQQSYLSGMVVGIKDALARSRWDALDTKEKRSLVPVMDKEVDDYLHENFKVETQKDYRVSDPDVFRKGKSAGLGMQTQKREEVSEGSL